MKRLDLIQIAFIIAGICSAFFSIDLVPRFVYYMFAWFSSGLAGGYLMEDFIQTILLLALYLIFTIYSIRNSKQLAGWISDKANLQGAVNINLQTKDVLFTFLTCLGIYGLIRDLPWLFSDLYNYLLVYDTGAIRGNKNELVTGVVKVGLWIVLLVYAHVFADYFAARIKNPEPPDEIMEKTEE